METKGTIRAHFGVIVILFNPASIPSWLRFVQVGGYGGGRGARCSAAFFFPRTAYGGHEAMHGGKN